MTRRTRWLAGGAAALLLALLAFVAAGPWLAMNGLRNVVSSGDYGQLWRFVDFDRLRESLRPQLQRRIASGIMGRMGPGGTSEAIGGVTAPGERERAIEVRLHAHDGLQPAGLGQRAGEAQCDAYRPHGVGARRPNADLEQVEDADRHGAPMPAARTRPGRETRSPGAPGRAASMARRPSIPRPAPSSRAGCRGGPGHRRPRGTRPS